MSRLDIVRIVISPDPSHVLRFSMVGYDLAVVGELFVTDGAFSVLLEHFTSAFLPAT